MATTRPIPQVNLKDRIAALQQRNAAKSQPPEGKPPPVTLNSARFGPGSSLREKIASFEKQGAVPVPRASFGMAAPPVDDGSSKRRGELIGNRVPGLSKPTLSVRKRTVSTSELGSSLEWLRSPPPTDAPILPLVKQNTGGGSPSRLSRSYADNGIAPRLPSAASALDRRSVSDALPRPSTYYSLGESLRGPEGISFPETDEDMPETPAIVVYSDPEPLREIGVIRRDDDTSPSTDESPSTPTAENTLDGQLPPSSSSSDPQLLKTTEESQEALDSASSAASAVAVGSEMAHPSRGGDTLDDSIQQVFDEPTGSHAHDTPTLSTGSLPEFTGYESASLPTGDDSAIEEQVLVTGHETPTPLALMHSESSVQDAHLAPGVDPVAGAMISSDAGSHSPAAADPLVPPTEDRRELVPEDEPQEKINTQTDGTPGSASSDGPFTPQDDTTLLDPVHGKSPDDQYAFADESFTSVADTSLALDAQDAVFVTAPTVILSPPTSRAVLVDVPETPNARREEDANSDVGDDSSFHGFADESLALDTRDAIIVHEPAKVVSPTVIRAVLVPAPHAPLTPAPPTPVDDDVFDSGTASFHAVVHQKVREGSTARTLQRSIPAPRPPSFTLAPVTPSRVYRVRGASMTQPDSPNADLAALMANAALLEEQLSGVPPPSAKLAPMPSSPLIDVLPATPSPVLQRAPPLQDIPESFDDESLENSMEASDELPLPTSPPPEYSQLAEPRIAFPGASSAPMRSPIEEVPPTPPAKSPRTKARYLSGLRASKPTMPGAFPRNSICSEVSSEESSVLVYAPSWPPQEHEMTSSDASSVRSSSRSWKSPKKSKSIKRAASFAERLFHRGGKEKESPSQTDNDSHLAANGAPPRALSPSLLSPHLGANARPSNPPTIRPTSWISVSSNASGSDVFDGDIFDEFPSVPQAIPPVPPLPTHLQSQPHAQLHHHKSVNHPPTGNHTGSSVSRPSGIPLRSKTYSSRHSALP